MSLIPIHHSFLTSGDYSALSLANITLASTNFYEFLVPGLVVQTAWCRLLKNREERIEIPTGKIF
jgi:hypothetical protein